MTDLEMLRRVCLAYEDELKKRMSSDEFKSFSANIAKTLLAEDVIGMADGEFKETCLNNFKALTGSDDEFLRFMESFADHNFLDDPGDLGDEDY